MDLGADGNFIDESFVGQHKIPTVSLNDPREVLAIDGKFLVKVLHISIPLSLTLLGNHHESLKPLVISSLLSQVVLGLPWLSIHNPVID